MKRWMAPLLITLMLGTSVFAAEQEIWEQWKSSPEYEKYSKLDPKSEEAKKLKEEAITKITKIVLQKYLATFDAKFQILMEKKVQELPIWLQWLLWNMDIKIKSELTWNYDTMTISRINTFMFNFVDSIYKDKWSAEKNISELPKIAPELANSKSISYLIELGKNYDDAAKSERNAAKSERNAAKNRDDTAKRQEVIDILKKM